MKPYKIVLALLSVSQFISTYATGFSGGSNFSQPLLTPAGYTFSIWSVITLFCLIHGIYHLYEKKAYSKKFYSLLSLTYILFMVWLLLAERNLLPATVVVFVVMLVSLFHVFKEVLAHADLKETKNKIFLQGGIGMYLGWSTIAVPANIAAMFAYLGVDNYSLFGQVEQVLVILLATGLAMFILKTFHRNRVLFGTFWWAFVGILVGIIGKPGTMWLIITTVVSVIALNVYDKRLR